MFQPNDKVKVMDVANVRRTPGHLNKGSSDVFTAAQPGQILLVVSGPHQADGLTWYELDLNGQRGFVAEAVNGVALLTAAPSPVPTAPAPQTAETASVMAALLGIGASQPTVASPDTSPAVVTAAQPALAPGDATASAAIPGVQYGKLSINGNPTDRPAAEHGDINLKLRGFTPTQSTVGLIDMNGPTDHRAPQFSGLFADKRWAQVSNVYRGHDWDWGSNSRGAPLTEYDVHVVGLRSQAGETVHVPSAGYDLGEGYQVLVLYASPERLTLKYTREDTVATGYAVHLENVHTEPSLLALYEQMNAQGRRELPAVRAGQAIGRARGEEIQVAIRDTGRFMDPRVRKDWWR